MAKTSLMTWNILNSEAIENIKTEVRRINPDILCVQELNEETALQANTGDKLAELFEYNYFEFAEIGSALGYKFLMGNGIFSKYPISETKKYVLRKNRERRIYIEAKLKVADKDLVVGTTHLSFTPRFESTPVKNKEADNLLALIKHKKSNFVLAGDFNSTPDTYAVKEIEKYLKPAGPDYNQGTFTNKPFDYMDFKADGLDWRIDYIFTTPDIKVISSRIIETEYSDHLPILAEIEI